MDANQILEGTGLTKGTLLASFFGALLSLRWIDKALGWGAKVTMLGGGFCTAAYGTPVVVKVMEIGESVQFGMAFFMGLFGISLIDAVYAQIKDGTLLTAIRARFGL